MFRRKKAPPRTDDAWSDDDDASEALERLSRLTDRLEDTTQLLASLVADMRRGADHD